MEANKTTMQYLADAKRQGAVRTEALKQASKKALKKTGLFLIFFGLASGAGTYGLVKVNEWFEDNALVIKSPVEVAVKTNQVVTITPRVKQVVVSSEKNAVDNAVQESAKPEVAKIICDLWGATDCKVAIAVFSSESGLNPLAVNWDTKDFGTAQINLPVWEKVVEEKFGYTRADLLTAEKNLEVAYWIWDRADGVEGDGRGSFGAWVAYTDGNWLAKL